MPNEFPNGNHPSLSLGLSNHRHISFKATSIRTSKDLKRLDPRKRFCYFENEKDLEFFKSYSRSNCMIECQAKASLEACGCVGYWMPRRQDTPICNISSFDCVNTLPKFEDKCDCYPVCNHIKYDLVLTEENSFNQVDMSCFASAEDHNSSTKKPDSKKTKE
jgi:acid-sensing ion channel, other